ncbi:MAG: hypothetical protein KatS3mg112_1626 [Thermogutta sp.]|nr:MAG: hypothetical protein KatS3mg112_1626 [Thermogutta sp.]
MRVRTTGHRGVPGERVDHVRHANERAKDGHWLTDVRTGLLNAGRQGTNCFANRPDGIVLPHFTNFHCFPPARFAEVINEARVRRS